MNAVSTNTSRTTVASRRMNYERLNRQEPGSSIDFEPKPSIFRMTDAQKNYLTYLLGHEPDADLSKEDASMLINHLKRRRGEPTTGREKFETNG